MNRIIPTYPLTILSEPEQDSSGVFFLNKYVRTPAASITIPYRRNFYAVGICLRGKAELKVNLETYTIESNCLLTKPPHTINQWTFMSDDFESLTIFFTKDFITTHSNLNPDNLRFFESGAKHSSQLLATQAENIIASLQFLQKKYDQPHPYRNEMLRSLIHSLLYEIASIHDQQTVAFNSTQTRSQWLTSEFKKLVHIHFLAERNLSFYADKLCITPKHLTETVKEVTGKTAGEWIIEAVILEAKVLLQNSALTVAQVSDKLHFADQSMFGKFFKKSTGVSPVAYKQGA